MATRPMKQISGLPGLEGNTYTFVQLDDTLTTAGKAADAKKTGDELNDLKSNINDIDSVRTVSRETSGNAIIYYPVKAGVKYAFSNQAAVLTQIFTQNSPTSSKNADIIETVVSQNFNTVGKTIVFTASQNANYVRFYFSADGGNCTVETVDSTESAIAQTFQNGSYQQGKIVWHDKKLYKFSENHSANWTGTDVDETTVAGEIADLDKAINGETISVSFSEPTSGKYYSGTVGNAISEASGSGYYYAPIDLSSYAGKRVRVSFTTTGSTSTRITALCSSSGVIGMMAYERDIYSTGYADFNVTNVYNKLYVSYNSSGTGLSVTVIENGLADDIALMPGDVVYVSTTGNDNNSGAYYDPLATIQAAVNRNARIVKVAAGEYAGFMVLNRDVPLTIMLADMPVAYDSAVADVPKIKITTSVNTGQGIIVENCADVHFSDVWVSGVADSCYRIKNVGHVDFLRCYADSNTNTNAMGFEIVNCNGFFRDCMAWDIAKDGFNIHNYGDTQFINCVAYDCGDDGISHHEGCTGLILGGEYYRCGKGGVASPYGGAKVDVQNVYSHDNSQYGLYAVSSTSGEKSVGRITNCVFKNNTTFDIIAQYNVDLIGWNNVYDTKSIGTNATFTELG